jgi:chromosome segregation ATPase
MAPYNVRAMARFVNIHKQGLREQAQQNEKMRLEVVKYIDTSKTQGFNDLQEAKLELVKHIDTWTNGYSDLLLEQLNSVSAEKKVLSERNAEITAALEVERELKRSKTEAFDKQGVELERVKTEMECVKQENYDLSKTKSELTGSLELKTEAFDQQGVELERVKKENYDMSNTNHAQTKELDRMRDDVRSTLQYNNDYADEVSRKNEVISQLQHQVSELNRDNKQLENEKASLYQLQQKRNRDDSPPRRFSVPKPGQW